MVYGLSHLLRVRSLLSEREGGRGYSRMGVGCLTCSACALSSADAVANLSGWILRCSALNETSSLTRSTS